MHLCHLTSTSHCFLPSPSYSLVFRTLRATLWRSQLRSTLGTKLSSLRLSIQCQCYATVSGCLTTLNARLLLHNLQGNYLLLRSDTAECAGPWSKLKDSKLLDEIWSVEIIIRMLHILPIASTCTFKCTFQRPFPSSSMPFCNSLDRNVDFYI